jgi:hypothetical protein
MITYVMACYKNDPQILDLFMDAEDDQVGGSLSLVQTFLNSRNTVYLVDVLILGDSVLSEH